LIILGDDFEWENAQIGYMQIDTLIDELKRKNTAPNNSYVGTQSHINSYTVKYSTPRKYVEAVKQELGANLKTFKGDFFPYIDELSHIWTGYFSSRPNFKRQIR
jgi:alpha-mannosidase